MSSPSENQFVEVMGLITHMYKQTAIAKVFFMCVCVFKICVKFIHTRSHFNIYIKSDLSFKMICILAPHLCVKFGRRRAEIFNYRFAERRILNVCGCHLQRVSL